MLNIGMNLSQPLQIKRLNSKYSKVYAQSSGAPAIVINDYLMKGSVEDTVIVVQKIVQNTVLLIYWL